VPHLDIRKLFDIMGLMRKRQTIEDRQRIKTELADNFKRWIALPDEELLAEVKKRFSAVNSTLPLSPYDRGHLLRFLTMDHLDKID
jgi:hypothetical protein